MATTTERWVILRNIAPGKKPKPTPATKTKKDYINYAYVYGVGYAAESAQMIGDWIRATELHYWVISFTDEYAKENNFRRGELIRHARDAGR